MTGNIELNKYPHWEDLSVLGLDDSLKSSAEALYFKIKSSEENESSEKSLILMRCASLVCSLIQPMKTVEGSETLGGHVNISNFLKNTSKDLNSYLTYLEKIQSTLPQIFSLQELIRKIEISKIIFIKFNETWEKVKLKGGPSFLSTLKQTVWLILINLKFCFKVTEVVEIGYLIISTFDTFLRHLDQKIVKTSKPYLPELTSFFKANSEFASAWVTKIEKGLQDYITNGDLYSKTFDLSGIFKSSVISRNLNLLNSLYQTHFDLGNIDERDLISLRQKILTPQKPRFLRQIKPSCAIGKVLNWDENFAGPTINSKLNQASLIPASPYIPPPTPMSMVMELNSWFSDLIKLPEDFKELISSHACSVLNLKINDLIKETASVFSEREIGTSLIQGLKFISENFNEKPVDEAAVNNPRIEELKMFLDIVIKRVLKREAEKEVNVDDLALNEEFLRSIFACCLEGLLFIHSILRVNFEEVLSVSGTTPFDFWKTISSFLQFDQSIPHSVRQHFREIEVKILCCLAWKEGSKLHKYIKEMKESTEELNDASLFLKKLLSHCANRILELASALNLTEKLKEEIWSTFKLVLSEKTEILINRHADYLVVCTIFAVCKLNSPVEFKLIIEKHRMLYTEDSNFFKKVLIQNSQYDTIIKFYNLVFIQNAKEFITHQNKLTRPRLEVLNPASPLRASIPVQMSSYLAIQNLIKSPLKSPFRTPRSDALWAKNELFSPTRKCTEISVICFDKPIVFKRPKLIEEILNTRQDIGPAPILKKEKTEENEPKSGSKLDLSEIVLGLKRDRK